MCRGPGRSQLRGRDSEYIEEKGNNFTMNKGMNECAERVQDARRVKEEVGLKRVLKA